MQHQINSTYIFLDAPFEVKPLSYEANDKFVHFSFTLQAEPPPKHYEWVISKGDGKVDTMEGSMKVLELETVH